MMTSLRKTGNTAAVLLAGLIASLPGMVAAGPPGGMPPPPGGPPPGGMPPPPGGPTTGPAGLPPMGIPGNPAGNPGGTSGGNPGVPGRELRPPAGFSRSPLDEGFPPSGLRAPAAGAERLSPRESGGGEDRSRVALTDAVSMVQQHFNATAVKTDTVSEDGQLVYRIRLLSADRSRVWTVNVDARTGQLR